MTKQQIIDSGVNGLPLSGLDVARISRSGRFVTYRHVWDESVDARAWHAIHSAAVRLAKRQANMYHCTVGIYSARGDQTDAIEPSEEVFE